MNADSLLLDSILEDRRQRTSLSKADYFEFFTFGQILKHHDLPDEELLAGRVGGGDDGGIDGFFEFVDGELMYEDTEVRATRGRTPVVDLYLIQSKQSATFAETPLDKALVTVRHVFGDLSKTTAEMTELYNLGLRAKVKKFQKRYTALAVRHARLRVHFRYVTSGRSDEAHPKVRMKAHLLERAFHESFMHSEVDVRLMGARELIDLSRQRETDNLQLRFVELIARGTPSNNYVVLATLTDYYHFVKNEHGELRKDIFDSNVRAYQGSVAVNREIGKTLRTPDPELDFWWLNNGITILTSEATVTGKTLSLSDVQVVNGLQTTQSIYQYWATRTEADPDTRTILIRVIERAADDRKVRDAIIRGTNNQTRLPPASLLATDEFQHDLEDYFKSRGWYYDRRKNFYRNEEMPTSRIVSIPFVAQGIIAIVLRQPDFARARPTTLITDKPRAVFDPRYGLPVFLFCAKTLRFIEGFLAQTDEPPLRSYVRSNLRFHAAMIWAIRLTGRVDYDAATTTKVSEVEIDRSAFLEALQEAEAFYKAFQGSLSEPTDTDEIVKGVPFRTFVLDRMRQDVDTLTPYRDEAAAGADEG